MKKMKHYDYRFRAECMRDVKELEKVLQKAGVYPIWGSHEPLKNGKKWVNRFITERDKEFPDVEVWAQSAMEIEELRDYMRMVDDGHVMVQTLNYTFLYTGERDCDKS